MSKSIFTVIIVSIVAIGTLTGCGGVPKDALNLNSSTLELRQLQTREYQTKQETKILAAGLGVMQDLGFTVDETEKKLGVVTASKDRDAVEAGQVIGAIFVAALGGGAMEIDNKQKIRASLVTQKSQVKKNSYSVRVSFQRVVWGTQGHVTKVETIRDPEIYKNFFDQLSKSVFLEGHTI